MIVVYNMDSRNKVLSRVFHNNGAKISFLMIAKSLYTDCKIEGSRNNIRLTFPSTDISKFATDYDYRQQRSIHLIQKLVRGKTMKARATYSYDFLNFLIEAYYLRATERILFKVFKKEPSNVDIHKLDRIKEVRLKYYLNMEVGDLFQSLTLNFSNIHHPQRLLTDEEIQRIINFIFVNKLYFENKFLMGTFFKSDIDELLDVQTRNREYLIYPKNFIHPKAAAPTLKSSHLSNYKPPNFEELLRWEDTSDSEESSYSEAEMLPDLEFQFSKYAAISADRNEEALKQEILQYKKEEENSKITELEHSV